IEDMQDKLTVQLHKLTDDGKRYSLDEVKKTINSEPVINHRFFCALFYVNHTFVISPAMHVFILCLISFSESLWPKRNINYVTAHSGVLSYPLITPISSSCLPVL